MSIRNVPMFDVPEPPPLTLTAMFEVHGRAKGAYTRYQVKGHVACHECIGTIHEGKGRGPLSRAARFARRTPDKVLLLCGEHADLWRKRDAEKFGAK